MLILKPAVTFPTLFFSLSLHQQFNRKGWEFITDDEEGAIHQSIRAINIH